MRILRKILIYLIVFLLGFTVSTGLFTFYGVSGGKLTEIEQIIDQCFIGEFDWDHMEDVAADGLISALGDRWSYYVTAEEYKDLVEQQENAYVGIGITITAEPEESGFRVIVVQENGSAQQAGILVDDLITAVNGESVAEFTVEDLRNVIRGKEGTTVQIDVLRGDAVISFTVRRSLILTPVVTWEMVNDDIGLIQIVNFDARCASESIDAIEALRAAGAKSLIFDVRNNPGGFAHEMVALLDYLLPEGELFRTVDYTGKETIDTSDASFLDMPIAVLCNEDSYSAAEFFAAAIQEYDAGTILGAPTCGKGYFQFTFPLSDGSAIGLSVGKYFTPQGKCLADTGIQPDIAVEVDDETYEKIYYGQLDPLEDPQILAAIDALSH